MVKNQILLDLALGGLAEDITRFSGATFGELQRSMAAGGGGLSSPGRNEGLESAGRIASVSAGGNASNISDMINRKIVLG